MMVTRAAGVKKILLVQILADAAFLPRFASLKHAFVYNLYFCICNCGSGLLGCEILKQMRMKQAGIQARLDDTLARN